MTGVRQRTLEGVIAQIWKLRQVSHSLNHSRFVVGHGQWVGVRTWSRGSALLRVWRQSIIIEPLMHRLQNGDVLLGGVPGGRLCASRSSLREGRGGRVVFSAIFSKHPRRGMGPRRSSEEGSLCIRNKRGCRCVEDQDDSAGREGVGDVGRVDSATRGCRIINHSSKPSPQARSFSLRVGGWAFLRCSRLRR